MLNPLFRPKKEKVNAQIKLTSHVCSLHAIPTLCATEQQTQKKFQCHGLFIISTIIIINKILNNHQ